MIEQTRNSGRLLAIEHILKELVNALEAADPKFDRFKTRDKLMKSLDWQPPGGLPPKSELWEMHDAINQCIGGVFAP